MDNKWKVWGNEKNYGDTFYKRSVGELPEMESSKSLARKIQPLLSENDHILDVGCGGGHYLVSLDKILDKKFSYTGIDATGYYIERATDAFLKNSKFNNPLRISTQFIQGDIFDLPLKSNFADIVICANVLLHLPSIYKPIRELVRVALKYVVIRTLIGDTAFRIKHIKEPEEYDENGNPENYYFYNIYSEKYIKKIVSGMPGIQNVSLNYDRDFNPENIGPKEYASARLDVPFNVTKIIDGMQVNHYIVQPWQYIILSKV